MAVYGLDPLADPRWVELIECHPRASVFHTRAWLDALQRTYGFEPLAVTTSAPDERLANGMVFCEIPSWLTGRRLVSLPFSDHCEPMVRDVRELEEICAWVEGERQEAGWRYVELRPCGPAVAMGAAFGASAEYCLHTLDLRPEPEHLFRAFHQHSTRRKIRRAERERLVEREGRGEDLLRTFYRLLVLTRRRHQLPPQPYEWFRALADCFGARLNVRIASQEGQPVASILTLRHRDTMFYKYGASDAALHQTGGMQFLLWRTIQDARRDGCVTLDLGRSDWGQPGLLTFKDRWGAARTNLTYWRAPAIRPSETRFRRYVARQARQALEHVPDRCRIAAGRIFYKHAG